MREIKFRALSVVGKSRFRYGSYFKSNFSTSGHCILNPSGMGHYEVDPKTVGQYTGLKDVNGVEIYEGDIVEVSYDGDEPTSHKVEWGGVDYPAFELSPTISDETNGFAYIYHCGDTTIKVIGNIHEGK